MKSIKQFSTGLGYVRKGFSFFHKHKRLWWYAIIPSAINIIVLIGMIFVLIHYYSDLTHLIFGSAGNDSVIESGFFMNIWTGFVSALIYIAKILIFIVLLIFLLIITFIIAMILAGPFNDALSEKVEEMAGGKEEIPFSWKLFVKSFWRSIIVELQKAGFFLTIPLLLLFLHLIPGIGSTIYLIIAAIFAAFDIGFNFFDYPMSRKLMTFSNRMKIGWKHKYTLVGFGIVSLIPLFPFIFGPQMVVGGTLMYIETN